MTVSRWWARSFARWKARFQGVRGDMSLFFNGVTSMSISSGVLDYFGAPRWALAAWILGMAIGLVAYAHQNAERGVGNQVNRDQQELFNNFSDPDKLINFRLQAPQLALIAYELQRDENREYEEILADMQDEMTAEWEQLRDGIDLEANGK